MIWHEEEGVDQQENTSVTYGEEIKTGRRGKNERK